MRYVSRSVQAGILALVTLLCVPAGRLHAAGLALPDAQFRDAVDAPHWSIDLAAGAGDAHRSAGLRIGYPLAAVRLFAEVSRHEQEFAGIALRDSVDAEAPVYGLGLLVPLPDWTERLGATLRVTGNDADFDVTSPLAVGGRQARTMVNRQSVAVDVRLNSAEALTSSGLQVFGGLGFEWRRDEREVRVDRIRDERLGERNTETVPRFSLGLVHPIGPVHLVAMIEEVDGASLYIGIRAAWSR